MSHEALKDALSTIHVKLKGEQTLGVATGVLILPFLVLTAWHVLESAERDSISVTSTKGLTSEFLSRAKGGIHRHDKDSDLAVFSLCREIGPRDIPAITTLENFTPEIDGFVVTYYERDYKKTAARLDPLSAINSLDGRPVCYSSQLQVGKGFSGSPVTDQSGKIMSIVSGSWGDVDREFIETNKGKVLSHKTNFRGPSPKKFAEFMSYAIG